MIKKSNIYKFQTQTWPNNLTLITFMPIQYFKKYVIYLIKFASFTKFQALFNSYFQIRYFFFVNIMLLQTKLFQSLWICYQVLLNSTEFSIIVDKQYLLKYKILHSETYTMDKCHSNLTSSCLILLDVDVPDVFENVK